MTSLKYSRAELGAIVEARRRSGDLEGQGDGAYFDFWFRITPEMLHDLMSGYFVHADGHESVLDSVSIDGVYVEPILTHRKAVKP
jgi:hypothetical protein